MVWYVLEEVTLGVSGVDTPPVVDEYVEYAKDEDKERGGPSRFEAYCDHDASSKTDD